MYENAPLKPCLLRVNAPLWTAVFVQIEAAPAAMQIAQETVGKKNNGLQP